MTRGRLFALGLGPGDPDLITVRARSILQHAPTLFVPVRRPGGRSYVLDIVSGLIDTSRQRVEVLPFPAGTWQEHVAKIVDELGRGDAAFLTEGDPLFYSTFIDVLGVLRAEYPDVGVQVVPGIASPMAAAAAIGWPLADDSQRLAVLSAMYEVDTLSHTLREFDTVVLLKVSPVLHRALDLIDTAGLGDRVVFARRIGRPNQCVLVGSRSIRSAPEAVLNDYFSLLIVRSDAV